MNTNTQRQVQLEQFFRGKWWQGDFEKSDFIISAWSPGIGPPEAEKLFANANLGPYSRVNLERLRHGYGLLRADSETCLLLHIRPGPRKARGYIYPDYRCIVVPAWVVAELAGNIQPLWALLDSQPHLPELAPGEQLLPPVSVTVEKAILSVEISQVESILHEFDQQREGLACLLTALIENRPVAIQGAPSDPAQRWMYCQGLLLLLPPQLRHQWTFATEVLDSSKCPALLKFLYQDGYIKPTIDDFEYQWRTGNCTSHPQSIHPYAQFVMHLADGGVDQLIYMLHSETVTETVAQLHACARTDILAILADRLVLLPIITGGMANELEWDLIQRLLTNQIRVLSQLEPMKAEAMSQEIKTLLNELVAQGFSAETFALLLAQIRTSTLSGSMWSDALEWTAISHLRQQGERLEVSELLQFMDDVRNIRKSLTDEAWNGFIVALWPLSVRDVRVTQSLLDLWLDYPTPVDYKATFLLDPRATAKFPEDLDKLRRYWLTSSPVEPLPALLAISSQFRQQDRFLLDMVEEAISRGTFELVSEAVLDRMLALAQTGEHKKRVLLLCGQIVDFQDRLESRARRKLPWLLVTLSRFDEAVAFLSFSQIGGDLPQVVCNLCRTAPLPDPIEFLQRLEQVPALQRVLDNARLGLLGRENWDIRLMTTAQVNTLGRICQTMTKSVLQRPESWITKVAALKHLWVSPAVIQIPTLKSQIVASVDQYVDELSDEQFSLQIMYLERAFMHDVPDLYATTHIPALAQLVRIFGSRSIDDIGRYIDNTANLLSNLPAFLAHWNSYYNEFQHQLGDRLPAEQQRLYHNCVDILTRIGQATTLPTEPLATLHQMLERVDYLLQHAREVERASEKSFLTRILGRRRDEP